MLSLELKDTQEHLWHQTHGCQAPVKPSGRSVKKQDDQRMQELVALVEPPDCKALVLIASDGQTIGVLVGFVQWGGSALACHRIQRCIPHGASTSMGSGTFQLDE